MVIYTFTCGPIREHPYLVIDTKTRRAMVIDPGGCVEEIIDTLAKENAVLEYIINTHFHPDHISHNAILKDMTHAKILIHKSDAAGLQYDWSAFSKKNDWAVIPGKADKTLIDNQVIKLGQTSLKVMHTPGHTPGSICLYIQKQKVLFTGDTLFYHAIGRTDLTHSIPESMKKSLKNLFELPKDTIIYPGHGKPSSIVEEFKFVTKNIQEFY